MMCPHMKVGTSIKRIDSLLEQRPLHLITTMYYYAQTE